MYNTKWFPIPNSDLFDDIYIVQQMLTSFTFFSKHEVSLKQSDISFENRVIVVHVYAKSNGNRIL